MSLTPAPNPNTDVVMDHMIDLDSPSLYLNRELTWLSFNRRVLHEARDTRTPLLERVKFLSIVSSNLDEFFMKRIGGLKQQVGAGLKTLTIDGCTPQQQIDACYAEIKNLHIEIRDVSRGIYRALRREGIQIKRYYQLSSSDQQSVRDDYLKNIFPLLTPQGIDPAHPFPFISNLSLNLLVEVAYPNDNSSTLVRIKVPVGKDVSRLIRIGHHYTYVCLEDVIANHIDLLFPGMEVISCAAFRVTRNAIAEQDEERADDLLSVIEAELRERRFAPIVRLEISANMTPAHSAQLADELKLDFDADVWVANGFLAARDWMQLSDIDKPHLQYPTHQPLEHHQIGGHKANLFHTIRNHGPFLLQHPYESFTSTVERFVRDAARDPKVRAIKMTLYRTSKDSKIISSLIEAAKNGKEVAVSVELKARFDERANIEWALRLEEAGIHVTYGVVGLKTHSKVVFVVRRDYDGLRRYAHIGTGNYHAGTARLYTDLGLLTCDDDIGSDMTDLFNYLTTGCVPKRAYKKLLTAPTLLQPALLSFIHQEIKHHKQYGTGLIQFKCNALEDPAIVKALYIASQAGVKIDLIVRDTCRLRPQMAGISDHIRVISIVGRFLEHSRIYYFHNHGDERYLIGSADAMRRNLGSRVEVVTPVAAPHLQADLRRILDIHLNDRRSAWEMDSEGQYQQRTGDDASGSHEQLIAWAQLREQRARYKYKRRYLLR